MYFQKNLSQVIRTCTMFGRPSDFKLGLQKTNYLHLVKLIYSLLDSDRDTICFISSSADTSLFSGIKRLKSLTYFKIKLTEPMALQNANENVTYIDF